MKHVSAATDSIMSRTLARLFLTQIATKCLDNHRTSSAEAANACWAASRGHIRFLDGTTLMPFIITKSALINLRASFREKKNDVEDGNLPDLETLSWNAASVDARLVLKLFFSSLRSIAIIAQARLHLLYEPPSDGKSAETPQPAPIPHLPEHLYIMRPQVTAGIASP